MPNGEPRPLLRDVAKVGRSVVPGEFDHWNSIRSISVTANAGTNDLRAVSGAVRAAIERAGPPPRRDIKVALHGQIEQMEDAFSGLARGLALAIVVVLLLLAATFESIRDALAILTVVPAVLSGVVVALLATRTSLNIQSFMGAITSVGVSVANAVLVVQFARERRRHGVATQRAVHDSATSRLRPILMTTLAMMAGMVPMALGLGEGGEQSAPLGRAVIGGIAASTVATLAVLPLVHAAIHGERPFATSSLVPLDAAPAPAQEGTS
jgi:multidrug efflux pump subunit AcrB